MVHNNIIMTFPRNFPMTNIIIPSDGVFEIIISLTVA